MPIERPAGGSDGRTRGRQSGGLERLVGADRREKIRRQPVRAARFWWCAVGDTADGNPGSDAHCGPCGRVSRASTAIGSGEERTRNFRRLSRENRGWNSGRSSTEAEEEVRTRGHLEPFFFGFRPPTCHLQPDVLAELPTRFSVAQAFRPGIESQTFNQPPSRGLTRPRLQALRAKAFSKAP
jgi:hypothetical protein